VYTDGSKTKENTSSENNIQQSNTKKTIEIKSQSSVHIHSFIYSGNKQLNTQKTHK